MFMFVYDDHSPSCQWRPSPRLLLNLAPPFASDAVAFCCPIVSEYIDGGEGAPPRKQGT